MADAIPEEVEVLVVGYGPVGAAIACLLGLYGVTVLVIDRAPGVGTLPRAISLDNEALRILQMVGLPEDAFEKVVIPFVTMVSPYVGEFARVNTTGTIDGHPKLVTFYQPALEQALRELAQRRGVTVANEVTLESFTDDGETVHARVTPKDAPAVIVKAKYLIAADGAASSVRTAIGQSFLGTTYPQDWLIVDAMDAPGEIAHIEFACDPRRPSPHMPAPGGRTRWEFMLRPGESREQMENDDDMLRTLLAPWGATRALRIERRAVYRFHARVCERFSKGRVFLAGDAAHVTPPFAGQGLVAGLRDAANLSWKLAWVLRGRASPSILQSYDQERRPHARAMIDLARFMGRLIMPTSPAAAVAIHGAMRLARSMPMARTYLDELGIKPKNRFAEGLFVPRSHGSRYEHGATLAQGRLRDASDVWTRSDDALGPSFALLMLGAADQLGPAARHVLERAGGVVVSVRQDARPFAPTSGALTDEDGALVPLRARTPWCVLVRPDRTVVHDGPAAEAERIVLEGLRVMRWPGPGDAPS